MSGRGKVSAVEVSYQFSPRASEALPEEMQRPRPRLACLSPGNQRGSGYFVGQLCRTADCTPAPPHLHGFGAHRTPGGGGGGRGPSFNQPDQPEILYRGPMPSVLSPLPRRVRGAWNRKQKWRGTNFHYKISGSRGWNVQLGEHSQL